MTSQPFKKKTMQSLQSVNRVWRYITLLVIVWLVLFIWFELHLRKCEHQECYTYDDDVTLVVEEYEEHAGAGNRRGELSMDKFKEKVLVVILAHRQNVQPYWVKAVKEKLIPIENTLVYIGGAEKNNSELPFKLLDQVTIASSTNVIKNFLWIIPRLSNNASTGIRKYEVQLRNSTAGLSCRRMVEKERETGNSYCWREIKNREKNNKVVGTKWITVTSVHEGVFLQNPKKFLRRHFKFSKSFLIHVNESYFLRGNAKRVLNDSKEDIVALSLPTTSNEKIPKIRELLNTTLKKQFLKHTFESLKRSMKLDSADNHVIHFNTTSTAVLRHLYRKFQSVIFASDKDFVSYRNGQKGHLSSRILQKLSIKNVLKNFLLRNFSFNSLFPNDLNETYEENHQKKNSNQKISSHLINVNENENENKNHIFSERRELQKNFQRVMIALGNSKPMFYSVERISNDVTEKSNIGDIEKFIVESIQNTMKKCSKKIHVVYNDVTIR